MENKEIKPFETEAAVVITDKHSNELNIEYYVDEIAMFGTYQSKGWNDEQLISIKEQLQAIHDALPDDENGEIPEDFKLSVQAGKKPPIIKVNFNIYAEEGVFKPKIADFLQKLQKGMDTA